MNAYSLNSTRRVRGSRFTHPVTVSAHATYGAAYAALDAARCAEVDAETYYTIVCNPTPCMVTYRERMIAVERAMSALYADGLPITDAERAARVAVLLDAVTELDRAARLRSAEVLQ